MFTRMLIALTAVGTASVLNAAEHIDAADRLTRTLTIYQQNLALFEERYQLPEAGQDLSLSIEGIAPQLQIDSLLATGIGTLSRLQLVSEKTGIQAHLQRYLGKPILLLSDSGEQREVTLLGLEGNNALISNGKYSEQISLAGRWRIALPEVLPVAAPPHLQLDARGKAGDELSLSYLSQGLSWQPSYHLLLQPAAGRVRLEGMAMLHNNSGIDLEQVQVRLLAGSVNQPQSNAPVYAMEARALRADSAAPQRHALQDYHLYTPTQPVSLANGQQLGIPLQAPLELPVDNHYRYSQYVSAGQTQPQTGHARREISFILPADADRKTPLPAGAARVFVQDEQQGLLFIGGQQLPATAAGETVNLTLGQAFDLTLEQEQIRFERQAQNSIVGYRIRIRNSGDEARRVEIDARFSQPYQLLESSHPSDERGLLRLWSIPVAANSEEVLEYSVRLQP